MNIYDINCTDLHGKPFSMRQFEGKPLLIVNTASLCGFSRQYDGIESIWKQNKDKGLTVLGIPCNDFGHQEPGNSAAIASLCQLKFGVTFPMLEKTTTKGNNIHPIFQWIAEEGGFLAKPRWNFYKYFVGRDGHLKDWFTSITTPRSARFSEAVKEVVGQ